MARVACVGLPEEVLRALVDAGHDVTVDPEVSAARGADVALVTLPAGAVWLGAARAARVRASRVALLTDPAPSPAASSPVPDGAPTPADDVDVIEPPWTPASVLRRLGPHLRAAAVQRDLVVARARELEATARAAQAAADLEAANEFFRRLVDASPDPVVATDGQGHIVVFNRAAQDLLGWSEAEARAELDARLLYADPEDALRVLAAVRRADNLRVEGLRVRVRSRTGESIPVALSAAQVHDGAARPVAVVGICRDMRQEDSLALRLEAATQRLIRAEKRAVAVEVAGAAAHELNQPLTSVMATLELLQARPDLPPDAVEKLDRAYVHLQRIADIVQKLSQLPRYRTTTYVDGVDILDLDPDTAG